MPELIGYDDNGNPQFSFSDEDKLKGISVRPHNALLDPAPVSAEQTQSALPVDVTGIGAVPTETTGFQTADKLFGLNGQERFQTWPERMVRSGVSLAHDVMTGELPVTTLRREDVTDVPAPQGATADSPLIGRLLNLSPVAADPRDPLIERAQDMAGLAGGATLGINPAEMTVASGMTKMAKNGAKLTPVEGNPFGPVKDYFGNEISDYHGNPIKTDENGKLTLYHRTNEDAKNKIYETGNFKSKENTNETFFSDNVDSEYGKGFGDHVVSVKVDPKYVRLNDQFPNGENHYAVSNKHLNKSVLFSDTQKPGMALAALEKPAPVFYSALENAVSNITANKMPADQWLGTLTNAKGVRPEEMEWTGLKDFLAEQKGPVTKDQVQQYLDANKVELKEVNKGESNYYRPVYKETLPRRMADFEPILKEINSIEDVGLAQKHNIAFKEITRGYDKEQILEAVQEAKNIPKYEEIAGKSFDTEAEALQAIKDANAEHHLQINPVNEYKDTKFSQYVLPGADNYRETLLTLPGKKYWLDGSPITPEDLSTEFGRASADRVGSYGENVFQSSHWDEPNVLAHVRMNDRTMPLEFTAEEKAALQAHADAQPALDNILKNQRKIALQIQDTAKPLEAKRRAQILADNKAGKLSNVEAMRQLENYESPVELKPLQDKLADLRAQEDKLRASLPEKPMQKNLKSLHLEEIQSDWHQIARDKGYAISADKIEKLRPKFEKIDEKLLNSNDEQLLGHPEVDGMLKMAVDKKIITPDEAKIYKQVSDTAQTGAVPDAPFKKTWHELVLKRMLREAAEKGYDRLSWTPGEAQAARYDLSKQVSELTYSPQSKELKAKGMDGGEVVNEKNVPPEKLADYVGKEAADKLINNPTSKSKNPGGYKLEGNGPWSIYTGSGGFVKDFNSKTKAMEELNNLNAERSYHHLSGLDLKVGGEGMKGFYDQIIPKALEKIGKEHGVKVKETEIAADKGKPTDYANYDDWSKAVSERRKQSIHYIDIPQSLKDQALRKGFPLFSSGVMLSPVEQSPFEPKLTPVSHNPFE